MDAVASGSRFRFIRFAGMSTAEITSLGVGIYTVPEASRLSGVSRERIRRWLKGYRSIRRQKDYSAVWKPQWPAIGSKLALGFWDLIEIKFVGAFLDRGLSWPTLHKLRQKAAEVFPNTTHPFCTRQFFTDGQAIFMEVYRDTGGSALLDVTADQQVFAEITKPFVTQLEYRNGTVLERWWPLGTGSQVVVDPRRNFGQPTIAAAGIPTHMLAQAVRTNGSIEEVAHWFEITAEAVQEAVQFERSLTT